MGKRLTDSEREQIADAIRAGEARNEIARRFGRSPDTVSRIAAAAGLDFDRTMTQNATAARKADTDARWEKLRGDLVVAAERLLGELEQPCVEQVVKTLSGGTGMGSKVQIVKVTHAVPPFVDKQRIMVSVGIAVDKVLAMDRASEGEGDTPAKGLLVDLIQSIRDEPDDEGDEAA